MLNSTSMSELPVAVLGGGPIGLAAVANLLERGIPTVILETGASVGANLLAYGHVRLFSPWRYNIDPAMARRLTKAGWVAPPPESLPLASDVVAQVLEPFAKLAEVSKVLYLNTKVVSVSRDGFDKMKSAGRSNSPFVVNALCNGVPRQLRARAVIDATGTWSLPNPVGSNGLPALGEQAHRAHIFYGIPDVLAAHRARYVGKRTLVVGSGHSAANALLALAELAAAEPATTLLWAVRSPSLERVFGGGSADALPARGELGMSLQALRRKGAVEYHGGLRIRELSSRDDRLVVIGVDADNRPVEVADIDEIICATGQRPDLSLTTELRVQLDPALESTEALGPLIDPNVHSCGTVRPHGHRELAHPEPGLYTVGVKSYGRAPTFLMATGFEQVRSVVAALAGDMEAADRVELDLPETGVCSTTPSSGEKSQSNCCTPLPDAQKATACCTEAQSVEGVKLSACCAPAEKEAGIKTTACCN
jgi:thioredoxin reductase